jgi:hypothetical protein
MIPRLDVLNSISQIELTINNPSQVQDERMLSRHVPGSNAPETLLCCFGINISQVLFKEVSVLQRPGLTILFRPVFNFK